MPSGEKRPVGRPPKHMTDKRQRALWQVVVKECHWADQSHRQWIERMVRIGARLQELDEFFDERRAEFISNGMPAGNAYFDDNGKRHPGMVEMNAAEASLMKMLTSLGATPAAQVKMMSNLTKAQLPANAAVEGSPADRTRFLT